jgi:UDP-2-acetamido-3-amino-2,3-dideoxy-glucuronate N-acetyltransferase
MSSDEVFIHPTAVVDEGAVLGAGSRIWHFCHVMSGAQLGPGCNLGQNVFVAGTARLGTNVKVQNNVSIYDGVICEDDVFLGPSCVFTNVSTPRSAVNRRGAYEPTHVGRGATIGANATIVCGVSLGPWSFVGAGAVVTHDVPAHGLVTGVPARITGWACACGIRLGMGTETASCSSCGQTYHVSEDGHVLPNDPEVPA